MDRRRLLSLSSLTGWTARFALLLSISLVVLLLPPRSGAMAVLKVDESNVRIFLTREPAELLLPIQNLSGADQHTRIHLELINPRSVNLVIKSGTLEQSFIPRLREYFPETLLWQPELTTDRNGHAHLDFKLADNITTRKVSVIGSNENGEVGTAETEIRAFQPFFAELDPPRVLTTGDRISLPVVLRNFLNRKQAVDLEIKPESWFTLLEGNRRHADVEAGDSTTQTFDLRATTSIKNGKQRVTAIGSNRSKSGRLPGNLFR
jgi:hypothetical protein